MRHDVLVRCARPREYYDAPDAVLADPGLSARERALVLSSMELEETPFAAGDGERPPGADAIARAVRSAGGAEPGRGINGARREFRRIVGVISGDAELDDEVARSACRLAGIGRGEATLAGLVAPEIDSGATLAALPTKPEALRETARRKLTGEAAARRARELDDLCARHCGGIESDLLVLDRPAVEAIPEICRRKAADVLVIGRREGGNGPDATLDDRAVAELAAQNLCAMLVVS